MPARDDPMTVFEGLITTVGEVALFLTTGDGGGTVGKAEVVTRIEATKIVDMSSSMFVVSSRRGC